MKKHSNVVHYVYCMSYTELTVKYNNLSVGQLSPDNNMINSKIPQVSIYVYKHI